MRRARGGGEFRVLRRWYSTALIGGGARDEGRHNIKKKRGEGVPLLTRCEKEKMENMFLLVCVCVRFGVLEVRQLEAFFRVGFYSIALGHEGAWVGEWVGGWLVL